MTSLSLKYRIALTIFVLEAVLVFLVLGSVRQGTYDYILKDQARQEEIYLSVLADLGHAALVTTEYGTYQAFLSNFRSSVFVRTILLADYRGIVVAGTDTRTLGQPLGKLPDDATGHWKSRGVTLAGGEAAGAVHIRFSREPLQSASRAAAVKGIIIALVSMIGSALIALVMGHILVDRLERLQSYTRKIAAGDLSLRCELAGSDEVAQLAAAFNDMTASLRASIEAGQGREERLRESEEKLARLNQHHELILRSAAEGILGLDMQGNHTFVNPAAARMLGYEEAELLGRPSHSLWHHTRFDGSPYPCDECEICTAYRDGAVHREYSEVFWRKDGTSFPVEYASTPIRERGRLTGAVVTFEDITERLRSAEEQERLEDQLRQAQKVEAIGQLAGGVAHDFNNMTAIVLGYGEMLLDQLRPAEPTRKYVEQIVAAGRRSATLTRQLLAFSRRQLLQPEVLDLNDLLRNLEQMLARLIGEDIELELKLAADLGCVTADPGQLEQVVTNLLVNARDAMPGGGRITVETTNVEIDEAYARGQEGLVPGGYALLVVSDTGCGMDKAVLARLFEPFFTTKEKGKGTGLGLATVYGIVKQSGGYISACSEPGQGASFRIYLPRTCANPDAKPGAIGGEATRGRGERILLVEDEAPLRELCETVLSRLGYRVSVAGSGAEALQLVWEQELIPDLVVTDVIMPGISGAEMADRLRRVRPDLRVLYMSGYPDDAIAHHGVLAPGTPFIQKPFTERALAVKVREALVGQAAAAPPRRCILMIDDDEQYRELVRHFCTRRGHVFSGVDCAAAALAALAGRSFDVLLVDLNIPGTSGERVLREIRAAGHAAPAIVLTGDVAAADMDVLRPLGAVRVLEKSSSGEPLLAAIDASGALNASQVRDGE